MKVKQIIVYPIKSIGGINLDKAKCTPLGFEHDRRMMFADHEGKFISQREIPRMARIGAEMGEKGYMFFDKQDKSNTVMLPYKSNLGKEKTVKVWKHEFSSRVVEEPAVNWFQDILGENLTLYKMDSNSIRYKSLMKAPRKTKLSMADGYPYLMLSQASLEDLNERLQKNAVQMDRFRANIIFEDSKAYAEEEIDKVSISSVKFRAIKPCARCSMITINQKTSEKLVEPLKTLSLYKKRGNKVYFGMNAISLNEGEIRIGEVVSNI